MKKDELNQKLDLILKNEKKILENEKKILGEEKNIEIKENKIEKEEIENLGENKTEIKDEIQALKELKNLEKELKENSSNPIKNITKKDILKGFIGAFIGIVTHFTFAKGIIIAENLNILNSTVLYITAFIIINLMLFYTGFRNIEKHLLLKFMPIRAFAIYLVSIITIILVYILFGEMHQPLTFEYLYNLIAANIILAVIGAGTADLIGKNE